MTTSACVSLSLSLPPATNNLYKSLPNGRRAMTSEARDWKGGAASFALRARTSNHLTAPAPKGTPVKVRLSFVLKHDRDVDNCKAVLDAFSGVLYDDDKQVHELTISKRKAAVGETPRVDVVVAWEVEK